MPVMKLINHGLVNFVLITKIRHLWLQSGSISHPCLPSSRVFFCQNDPSALRCFEGFNVLRLILFLDQNVNYCKYEQVNYTVLMWHIFFRLMFFDEIMAKYGAWKIVPSHDVAS